MQSRSENWFCTVFFLGLLNLVGVACSRQDPLLVGLQSGDLVVVAQTKDRILALDAGARVRLCRKGMQLEDMDAATWCALRLTWRMLDNSEAPRFLDLLWPVIGSVEGKQAFHEFRSLMGSSEYLAYVKRLEELPPEPVGHGRVLTQLHRQLRVGHMPVLCELMLSEDLELASAAFEGIRLMTEYVDGPREIIARTLLKRPRDASLKGEGNREGLATVRALPPLDEEPGYPALLRACLREYCLPGLQSAVTEAKIRDWVIRWARAEEPGPTDKELLLLLLETNGVSQPYMALQGLRRLGDLSHVTRIRSSLEELENKGKLEHEAVVAGHATLASLGSSQDVDWLIRDAKKSAFSIALLLDLEPETGRQLALSWLRVSDLGSAIELIRLPGSPELVRYGVEFDAQRDLSWLQPLLLTKQLPLPVALAALQVQPWFRTRGILKALSDGQLWKVSDQEEEIAETYIRLAREKLFFALLETSSREVFIRFMEELSRNGWRYPVYEALLSLGAPELEDFILDVYQEPDVDYGIVDLGNTQTPKVHSFLRQIALDPNPKSHRMAALCALAIAQGIPAEVAWLTEDMDLTDEQYVRIRDLVLADKAVPALAIWIQWTRKANETEERAWFDQSWAYCKDPRITRLLLSIRKHREEELYPDITRALALHGYPPAVEEVEDIYRTGRYLWIDEAPNPTYLPGGNLGLIPYWISELETNCFRAPEVNSMFRNLFGTEFLRRTIEDRNTLGFHARQWWKQAEGRLRYSRILGRYVISVREEK